MIDNKINYCCVPVCLIVLTGQLSCDSWTEEEEEVTMGTREWSVFFITAEEGGKLG